ncbi:hypothetical protein IG631_13235 [Alternaria alternata]|nr:hypothetical protein IG631_13235 [Alternaria alternata]
MADVGQLLLQNELFIALGATLFAALPVISPYWLPVLYPNSAPEQYQLSSGAAIATTVTRTATIFPKPTTLTDKVYQTIVQTRTATRTATTTATVPKTIYDTVTAQITSVSTYYDRSYITKWTHLSIGRATPCTTMVYTPEVTTQSRAPPRNVVTLPTTMPKISSWVPWGFFALIPYILLLISLIANMIMWVWDPRVIKLLGDVQASQETLESMRRSRQDLKDKYQTDQANLIKRCEKAERAAVIVQARDIMLQKLGVPIPSDEADDRELDRDMLVNLVQARMNVLADEKQRLGRLETENSDQIAEINGLKETITTWLSNDYVPGVSRSFDSLLFDKQREIDNLRQEIRGGNFGEDIKTNHVLHQEKDVELNELRPLRGEVEILRQALAEAKKEITRVEEETRDKGVADQRRRNEERTSLLIGRSEGISVLKDKHASKVTALEFRLKERIGEINIQKNKIADLNAQLHKAKRSLTSSHKTHQPQSPARPVVEAPRQRFNGTNSKQNTFTENEDYLRRSLDEKDQEYRDLQQNFMILAKQYKEKVEELEKLESQITNEKEHCENEKNLLRRRIVELERVLEVAQIHGSQPSTVTGPTTNELQYGSTIPESSSKAHEISKTQLKKQIVDLQEANEAMAFVETNLRTQIASLSKDIQTKEVREDELSTQVSKSREQLQAKCAQEQVLFSQVATLTQQRDAAVEETTGVKKQLEEAMSKGEAVWGELQELKVARNNNEAAQRNQDMGKLEKSNIDLQGQCDQLRQQGMHEINSRDRQIQKLRTDAATGNQTIHDLEQRLLVLKAENNTQSQVIRALKNELQAEKDRYLIDVNDLKNDVDHAQRETEKEKHGRKDDVRLAREREAKAIDEVRRERQQEIDDLKNSQESSTIKKLQERVGFYQMENTDLLENGKEGWKNLLLRKNQEIQKKESEISSANSRIRHWHRLYNIFHRRFEGLQGNKAYKEGEVSYAEARAGLFMGNDSHISTAMEKCVKFTEDLEAEVRRLKEEVERLRKYDEKVVEEEMNMDETIE